MAIKFGTTIYFVVFLFLINVQYAFGQFMIKVTSHSAANELVGEPYLLIPGQTVKNIQNTLVNKSHTALIEKVLASKKYARIIDTFTQKPSLIIEYDYYTSSPENLTEIRYMPTYSPGTSVNSNVTVNTQVNSPIISSNNQRVLPEPIVANSSNNNVPIFNLPSGYTKVETQKTVYNRTLILKCFSLNNGIKEELWITEAESTGPTEDINEVVPALIFSIKNYVGKNNVTPKIESVKTSSNVFNRFIKN